MPYLSTIILAGGRSSRMGRDKALLQWRGKPLIQGVYAVAAQCSDRIVVVTPWPERYRPYLPPACSYVAEVLLGQINIDSGAAAPSDGPHGPLIGFYQGLSAITTDWVLLLACDLPRLQPEPLQFWAAQLGALPEATIAYLPRGTRGWEPLCGFYRRRSQEALREFITAGGRSFQQWLQQQSVAEIPHAEGHELLYNCNTPQDWQQLQ